MTNKLIPDNVLNQLRSLENKVGLGKCLSIRQRLNINELEAISQATAQDYKRELRRAIDPVFDAKASLSEKRKKGGSYAFHSTMTEKLLRRNRGSWLTEKEIFTLLSPRFRKLNREILHRALRDLVEAQLILESTDKPPAYISRSQHNPSGGNRV